MADSQDSTPQEIPKGFCQCGCGQKTAIAKKSNTKRGWIAGEPVKFVHGHGVCGSRNPRWNGGKKDNHGYVLVKCPSHPRASKDGYVGEHILVVEKALSKYLPLQAVPHHVNGKKHDNRPENLVACENDAYHKLLHRRARALKECGHTSWRKCPFCKQYDSLTNLREYRRYGDVMQYHHVECKRVDARRRWHLRYPNAGAIKTR